MKGTITRRGKTSWRLKYDLGRDAAGKRKIRYVTVRGKRADAERELAKHLTAFHAGTSVEPSKITVAEYLRAWLDAGMRVDGEGPLALKTLERYRQIAEQQVIPHLGATALQKLKPLEITAWHTKLLASGGKDGAALSPRTVGHAHRLLSGVLHCAMGNEVISRNVVSVKKAPKAPDTQVEILEPEQVPVVVAALTGHALGPIVSLALATGMRRGELLALRWCDTDLEARTVHVGRSIEQTKAGLRFKAPKTKAGTRDISLPQTAVDTLREHRRAQLEQRVARGLGRDNPDALVFCNAIGEPIPPNDLSRDWARTVKAKGLPQVSFHALRHTHASALIAGGIDVAKISARLGHASPAVTLTVYIHAFKKVDTQSADAIEAVLRGW